MLIKKTRRIHDLRVEYSDVNVSCRAVDINAGLRHKISKFHLFKRRRSRVNRLGELSVCGVPSAFRYLIIFDWSVEVKLGDKLRPLCTT